MSSNSPAPLFTNSTAAAAGPSSAAQFDPAAQEQTVTTLLLVLILGPLPPILLVACCALARHCLRKLRRKWAKRRARGGSRSRSPLGRRARRNSGSLTPLTNRSTTYADLELSSPRESDAGSAAAGSTDSAADEESFATKLRASRDKKDGPPVWRCVGSSARATLLTHILE